MAKVAIFVDGAYYRKRALKCLGNKSPKAMADELERYCYLHLNNGRGKEHDTLYRIFYYDCPPMDRLVFHPFLHRNVVFKKKDLYGWMTEFLEALKKKRKFALRLGELSTDRAGFSVRPEKLRAICEGKIEFSDLTEQDWVLCGVDQKGVDMKIGIDIASLAYKKFADKMILISGDSDFVPAAKLARREGVDFVLDSLGQHIKDSLFEHIDGLCWKDKAFSPKKNNPTPPTTN